MAMIRGYVAQSLDGYIATRDHGLDWLPPIDGFQASYDAFLATVATVVMGRSTFDVVAGFDPWPYPGRRCLVVTSRPLATAIDGVAAWRDGVPALVRHLRALDDGDVWIVGGGGLQSALLDAGALDTLEVFVMPLLLGDGIPLWPPGGATHRASLVAAEPAAEGAVRALYSFD